jgi:hypothetical protein
MLCGETVAVYCENHMEHTDIYKFSSYLTGNTIRHRYKAQPVTQYVTDTKPKRLMLFGETVAVYCENHTEHTDIYKLSSYLTGNTLRLRYKA